MIVRESITSFVRGENPRKVLGIGDKVPGEVYKIIWNSTYISYYMLLGEKFTSGTDETLYLVTSLGTYNYKNHVWLVPYNKRDISTSGSQRSGFWKIENYNEPSSNLTLGPINENDIKKLLRYFSKPRNLSYLQELKDQEGIIPGFLEHLLT
jgi:hypothetical protein